MLRLGHGENLLDLSDKQQFEHGFNRLGRVDHMLARREELLQEVSRLAASIHVEADVGATCETATYFYLHSVKSRWEEFMHCVAQDEAPDAVKTHFPFRMCPGSSALFARSASIIGCTDSRRVSVRSIPDEYFATAPQPLFHGVSKQDDLIVAEGCLRHLARIFDSLEEIRPFELLRSSYDRTNYLLIKQAKIIAMTCTHAALKVRHVPSCRSAASSLLTF